MLDESLKKYIAQEDMTIVEAMQRIDANAGGVLYVVDEEEHLIGSLTDGDIRRWIIRSGDITAVVSKAMRSTVRVLPVEKKAEAVSFLAEHKIVSVPVIDEERKITDIVIKQKSHADIDKGRDCLSGVPIIVMAGGRGTRLYPYTKILPKPLIPVDGVPILERILDRFAMYGADAFYLTVNYRKEMIRSYFNELNPSYRITYVEEEEPLGTAGSIRLIKDKLKGPVIVTNCDILIRAKYEKLLMRHRESGNCMTIVSSLKNTRLPYGVLHVKEDGIITSVEEKPTYSNLINTGMYVLEPEVISRIPEGKVFHMTDLIEVLMQEEMPVGMFPISENSFLDMGEFEELGRMEELLKNSEELLEG